MLTTSVTVIGTSRHRGIGYLIQTRLWLLLTVRAQLDYSLVTLYVNYRGNIYVVPK